MVQQPEDGGQGGGEHARWPQTGKDISWHKDSLSDLDQNIKPTNIHMTGVLEGEETEIHLKEEQLKTS